MGAFPHFCAGQGRSDEEFNALAAGKRRKDGVSLPLT
jgi:hypothetical protein